MIDAGFVLIMNDGNDVEPGFQVDIVPEYISIRRPDESLLLIPRHRLFRLGKHAAAPGFYLDDNQEFLILRNEVYLIASRPPVDVKDNISLLQEVLRGDLFAFLSKFVCF